HTRFSRDWSSDVCSSDLTLSCFCHSPADFCSPLFLPTFFQNYMAKMAHKQGTLFWSVFFYSWCWSIFQKELSMVILICIRKITRSEERRVGKECGSRWSR